MSDDEHPKSPRKMFGYVLALVGAGLIVIAGLESFGLIGYRAHRQPVGATTWLIAGSAGLAAGLAIMRLRG